MPNKSDKNNSINNGGVDRKKAKIQGGAGSPKIYAEDTQRPNWVMPLSVVEGLRVYLDSYKEEIKRLRDEKNKCISVEDLEGNCWTWIEKRIKGTYKLLPHPVSAGGERTTFDDIPVDEIELDDLIPAKTKTTYFARVTGKSMVDLGIDDSDILLAETFSGNWTDIKNGTIVIATYNDELMVKIFHREPEGRVVTLYSANRKDIHNSDYDKKEIDMVEEQVNLNIQGIVKQVIKSVGMVDENEYLPKEA